jgi:hypothetical protein
MGARVEQAQSRVRDLDEAVKRLRFLVGHGATRTNVTRKLIEAISQANALHMIFEKRPDLYQPLADEWYSVRKNLDELARYYGVPGIGE